MAFSFANKIKKNAHGILCLSELKIEKHEFCLLSYDAKNACQELNSSKKVKVTLYFYFFRFNKKKTSCIKASKVCISKHQQVCFTCCMLCLTFHGL
jgi:hypothetical protein